MFKSVLVDITAYFVGYSIGSIAQLVFMRFYNSWIEATDEDVLLFLIGVIELGLVSLILHSFKNTKLISLGFFNLGLFASHSLIINYVLKRDVKFK
jgi:hypothetical protein